MAGLAWRPGWWLQSLRVGECWVLQSTPIATQVSNQLGDRHLSPMVSFLGVVPILTRLNPVRCKHKCQPSQPAMKHEHEDLSKRSEALCWGLGGALSAAIHECYHHLLRQKKLAKQDRTCPMCSFELTNPGVAPECWDAFDSDDHDESIGHVEDQLHAIFNCSGHTYARDIHVLGSFLRIFFRLTSHLSTFSSSLNATGWPSYFLGSE